MPAGAPSARRPAHRSMSWASATPSSAPSRPAARLRREFALFDETAIWKQILLHTGCPMTPQDMEARIVRYGESAPLQDRLHRRPYAGIGPEGELHHHRRRRVRKPRPARPYRHPARVQHRRGGPAAEMPQLAAPPPHGRGVLCPVRAAGGSSGAAGARRARWCWKRATSSTSPPAFSAASRISAPITG